MRWPWRRFEAFFDRHTRRKARAQIEAHRDGLIMAINANSNYDGKENADAKTERIRGLIDSSKIEIEILYAGIDGRPEEPDPFAGDDLFRPLRNAVGPPVMAEAGTGRQMLDAM
jgi:hypothetical protein